jgi:hypothetical protein
MPWAVEKPATWKNKRQDHEGTSTNEEPKNAARQPLKPRVPSKLDGGVIDVKGRAPRSVRVLVLGVVGPVRMFELAAVGVLRFVVRRVTRLVV